MLRPGELEIAKNAPPAACSPETAQRFTKWLATHHYENFNVVSWLLPKELHQHFYNVIGYCLYSANPVGRLVLYLCGYRDGERQRLSDATCTALQLANFWQDVSRDLEKGRIYIPLDVAAQHRVNESEIVNRQFSDRYVALMKDLTARTRRLFAEGYPLAKMVDGRLSIDLEMFSRGGIAVLDAIEAI